MKKLQKIILLTLVYMFGLQQNQQAMQRLWGPAIVGAVAGVAFQWYKKTQQRLENQRFGIKDFPKLGVEYSNSVDTAELTSKQLINLQKYKDIETEKYQKHRIAYQEKIRAGYEAPLYLKLINNRVGYGVFAQKDIQPGEFVGLYAGSIIKGDSNTDFTYAWLYSPRWSSPFAIDAAKKGNFMRFVNHSYNPNIKPKYVYVDGRWHVAYVARRLIKKDQQLFVDYGPQYWSDKNEPEELNPSLEQILENPVIKLMAMGG